MNYCDKVCKHLTDYKNEELGIKEDGIYVYRGRKVPKGHILPIKNLDLDSGYLNILPEYRKSFIDSGYSNIKFHRYFHHLNSSQAMCINLLFPLIAEKSLNLITEYLGIKEGHDLIATFEKLSELEPKSERRTNFDFHLQCFSSTCSDIFFEVKYTENGFGKAKADDDHKNKFNNTYLNLVNRSKYLSEKRKNESLFLEHYQLLRNLVHIEDTKFVIFLFPSANSKAKREVKEAYDNLLNDLGRTMVRIVFLEELLAFLEIKSTKDSLSKYYSSFRRKYILD